MTDAAINQAPRVERRSASDEAIASTWARGLVRAIHYGLDKAA
jgi:hypothetical protein